MVWRSMAAVPSGLGDGAGEVPCGEAEAVPAGCRGRVLAALLPGEAAEAGLVGWARLSGMGVTVTGCCGVVSVLLPR